MEEVRRGLVEYAMPDKPRDHGSSHVGLRLSRQPGGSRLVAGPP